MIDFTRLLSPESLARLEITRKEMERLYRLPDRWLAEELLRLARRARAELPERLGERRCTYDTSLVWDIIPEIAKRLGSLSLMADEALCGEVRAYSGLQLRQHAGQCLRFTELNGLGACSAARPSAADLLGHEVANGNPVAMAVDRVCAAPPRGEDREDYIARSVREISRCRGFHETAAWHPGLQAKRDRDMDR